LKREIGLDERACDADLRFTKMGLDR